MNPRTTLSASESPPRSVDAPTLAVAACSTAESVEVPSAVVLDNRSAATFGKRREPPKQVTGLLRVLYIACGFFFLVMTVLGVILPVLPSAPFLVAALYFFARSDPAWADWLRRNRFVGSLLQDWENQRAIRPHVRWSALGMLSITATTGKLFGGLTGVPLIIFWSVCALAAVCVWRIPLVTESQVDPEVTPALRLHSVAEDEAAA